MLTRHTSAVLLAFVGSITISMAFAQSQSPQGPSAQNQIGGSAQVSGQGAVAVGRSGATTQGSANSEAAAHLGGNSAQLAGDSSVNAVLTEPMDSRKSKPGDQVSARTTQPCQTNEGWSIPKGSTLVGHVSEAHSRGEGQADSAVGIVFDKAVMKDGREIVLRNVGIRALAAAEGSAAGSVGNNGMMGAGGMGGGGLTAGRGGGGLVGRTTGAVGGTVGGNLGAAGGVTGSLTGGAVGMLQGGPGAVGGLDASGLLTTGSSGVFGLRDIGLAAAGSTAAQGSVVTSTSKTVHLDQGTRMLLGTQVGASARGDRESDAASAQRSHPDKR